jgi:uncharacterized protein (TIGR03067 family)
VISIFWLAASAIAVAAPAPDPEKFGDPAKLIQGVWVVKSLTTGGKEDESERGKKVTITKEAFKLPEGQPSFRYKLGKVDSFRTLELIAENTSGDDPVRALYKIEGDTLTICISDNDHSHLPKSFGSSGDRRLLILAREKR